MIRAQRLLRDRQRAFVERLGFDVFALRLGTAPARLLSVTATVRMIRAQRLLRNRQRAFAERLGFHVFALRSR
jgi:uncharacterized protein (DUF934 family)